jgi:Zn-finger nucleic acid-binding protein
MWLDNTASQQVVTSLPAEASELAQRVSENAARRVSTDATDLPCPVCGETLKRTRVAQAWLDVDICERHGTWFDRGEIARVARAMTQPSAGDWRRPEPAKVQAVAPQPMTRGQSDHDIEEPLIRNTYLRGFFNIFRELIEGASEAEWEFHSDDDW